MDGEMFWTVVRANGFCFFAVVLLYIGGRMYSVYRQRIKYAEAVRAQMEREEKGELHPDAYLTEPPRAGKGYVVGREEASQYVQALSLPMSAYLALESLTQVAPELSEQARTLMNGLRKHMTAEEKQMLVRREASAGKGYAQQRVGTAPAAAIGFAYPPGEPASGYLGVYIALATVAERKPELNEKTQDLMDDLFKELNDYERKMLNERGGPLGQRPPSSS